jgi:hypothetical protein
VTTGKNPGPESAETSERNEQIVGGKILTEAYDFSPTNREVSTTSPGARLYRGLNAATTTEDKREGQPRIIAR